MSQHDMDVANQTTPNFRADMNSALQALASNSLGTTAPATTYAGMFWIDTTAGYLKQRNTANNAWVIIAKIDTDMLAALQTQTFTGFDAAGTAPTFTITPAPAITAYAAKQRFRVKFNGTVITGTPTLNVNALGAKNLKQYDSSGAKITAVIAANQVADCEYDGTDFVVLDPLPTATSIRGAISGLVVTKNGAAPTTTVDISAGQASDSTNAFVMTNAATFSKRINATFTAGSGNGGLDSGAVAASSEYWLWMIRKDSDGSSDFLFSLSATAPTMPGGYTAKRLIGWVLTDGSSNIVAFNAYETAGGGIYHQWDAVASDSTTALATTAASVALRVPTGIKSLATVSMQISNASLTSMYGLISSLDQTDVAVTASTANVGVAGGSVSVVAIGEIRVMTDTAKSIRVRGSAAASTTVIRTKAFEWSRR